MTKKWRPKDWPESPCKNCPSKVEDGYGLFCDIVCGKATAHTNYESGADALYDALWKLARESPTGTFTFDTNTTNIYEEA